MASGFLGAALGGFGGSVVGGAVVQLLLDDKQFQSQMAKAKGQTQATATGFSKFGTFAAAGFSVAATAAVAFAAKAVNAASDEEEALNKVAVVFGKAQDAVVEMADTSAEKMGISRAAALQAAGGFGVMLDTAGLAADKSADMSVALVKLAGDLASFNNIDPTEALEKLRSGLAGEAEPLRTVGVLLSEARVKAEAYAAGIAKNGEELTEAQKVQARYNLILDDTQTAQGDFARTSDSVANRQRTLTAKITDTAASIGKDLLPAFGAVVDIVAVVVDALEPFLGVLTDIIDAIANLGQHQIVQDIAGSYGLLGDAASYTGDQLNATAKEVDAITERVIAGNLPLEDAIDLIREKGRALGETSGYTEEWIEDLRLAAEMANFEKNQVKLADTAVREYGAGHQVATVHVRRFANLTDAALKEWKKEVRTSLREVSLSLDNNEKVWKTTADQVVTAARRMARNAATIAEDLDKLADIKAPDVFKKWLVEQGPGWVHGYVEATRGGKDKIEGYWRDAAASTRDQKGALDEVTTKVQGVGRAVNNLPKSKDIDINLRLNTSILGPLSGVADSILDSVVSNALAGELIRGQTG